MTVFEIASRILVLAPTWVLRLLVMPARFWRERFRFEASAARFVLAVSNVALAEASALLARSRVWSRRTLRLVGRTISPRAPGRPSWAVRLDRLLAAGNACRATSLRLEVRLLPLFSTARSWLVRPRTLGRARSTWATTCSRRSVTAGDSSASSQYLVSFVNG